MLVDLTVAIMQVTVSAKKTWVTIFIIIMQAKTSVAIRQAVFFANITQITVSIVIMQITVSVKAMEVTISSNNLYSFL